MMRRRRRKRRYRCNGMSRKCKKKRRRILRLLEGQGNLGNLGNQGIQENQGDHLGRFVELDHLWFNKDLWITIKWYQTFSTALSAVTRHHNSNYLVILQKVSAVGIPSGSSSMMKSVLMTRAS